MATVVPAVGMTLLALSLIFFYPLSKKKVQDNIDALKKRREN